MAFTYQVFQALEGSGGHRPGDVWAEDMTNSILPGLLAGRGTYGLRREGKELLLETTVALTRAELRRAERLGLLYRPVTA